MATLDVPDVERVGHLRRCVDALTQQREQLGAKVRKRAPHSAQLVNTTGLTPLAKRIYRSIRDVDGLTNRLDKLSQKGKTGPKVHALERQWERKWIEARELMGDLQAMAEDIYSELSR